MSKPALDQLSPTQRALLALKEMRAKLDAVEHAQTEPIAVVGMSCRFPGNANSPGAYWKLLTERTDAIQEVPLERWDIDQFYDPNPDTQNKTYSRWGGFLEDIDHFDAPFFRISPREAKHMDPQQRLLLETAWEALEHAGQIPKHLVDTQTGVFVGIQNSDYLSLIFSDITQIGAYSGTGVADSVSAGRLSFALGLQGPSVAVDTACSSSLVTIHLACQSLRAGESELALAGGVNLTLTPELSIYLSRMKALSPDGRCMTFDAKANGYVRSEGCGFIVLKRLSDAQRDGDTVLALIRGSAVNHDGQSSGLTVPNGLSQQNVMRQALAQARVDPQDVSYLEAHGTGTALGDPIEMWSIKEVMGRAYPKALPLYVGAAKTNIGHLESAAGIAGIIKTVLALQHQTIPPLVHYRSLNPNISLAGTRIKLPQTNVDWVTNGKPRIAGVSAFAVSGTNAHVILEEAPASPALVRRTHSTYVLPLSAKTPQALTDLRDHYTTFLKETETSLADLCYSASVRRIHHSHRLALVADSKEALAKQLATRHIDLSEDAPNLNIPKQPVFVFSGQGSQYAGMGQVLLATEPVFAEAFSVCDQAFQRYASWSLLDLLKDPSQSTRFRDTEVAQPVICAFEIALAALWKSWGMTPKAVVGHSIGEVAAAHVAGMLSVDEAMRIAHARGHLMQAATGTGTMVAVGLPEAQLLSLLTTHDLPLDIAAVNAPDVTVVAGPETATSSLTAVLEAQDIFYRVLDVAYAFHSAQMQPFADALPKTLGTIERQAGTLPVISTVTGATITTDQLDAAYWGQQLRQPVRFADAIQTLIAEGYTDFIEIGPRAVLTGALKQCIARYDSKATVFSAPTSDPTDERRVLLRTVASLHQAGYTLVWSTLAPKGKVVALPAYPWQRESYWVDTKLADANQKLTQRPVPVAESIESPRSFLGHKLPGLAHTMHHTWETSLSLEHFPELGDHLIHGSAALSASAYVVLIQKAALELWSNRRIQVTDLDLQRLLIIPETDQRLVQVTLTPTGDEAANVHIYSRLRTQASASWTLHATANVACHRVQPHVVQTQTPASQPLDFALMFFAGQEDPEQRDTYRLVIEAARFADQNGFSGVWAPERHFTTFGAPYPNPAVLHAALARETQQIRLRAGSVVLPIHNPIRIVEEWAMVDNLSKGRVELSFASGWHPNDFTFFPDRYANRRELLFEELDHIKHLWHSKTHAVENGIGKTVDLRTYPTPVQRDVPIWITAAGNPVTFQKAGAIGANLLTHLLDQDSATLGKKIALYREARAAHGFDPDAGKVSVMLHTFIGSDIDVVREQVRDPYCTYLKSIAHLLTGLAESRGRKVDLKAFSEEEQDTFINFLFERFFSERALLGTAEGSATLLGEMQAIGVNEIACLIDFGVDTDLILQNLRHLSDLKDQYATAPSQTHTKHKIPDVSTIQQRCSEMFPGALIYDLAQSYGLDYGASYKGVTHVWRQKGEALAHIRVPPPPDETTLSPGSLDACLQTLALTLPRTAARQTYLPVGIDRITILNGPTPDTALWSHATLHPLHSSDAHTVSGDILVFDEAGTVVADVQGLRLRRVETPETSALSATLAHQLYTWDWEPITVAETLRQDPATQTPWLVFADQQGFADTLVESFESSGIPYIRVDAATSYAHLSAQTYSISPCSVTDYQQLLTDAFSEATPSCAGLLYLWPLDAPIQDAFTSVEAVLRLMEAMTQHTWEKPPKLWLTTSGGQSVQTTDTITPNQALYWGLGRSFPLEFPQHWGQLIDLDPEASWESNANHLVATLRHGATEDQLAFRANTGYAPRLHRYTPPEPSSFAVKAEGYYLVTGGLGGLGFEAARWLVHKGAQHLLLVGRTPLPPRSTWATIDATHPQAAKIHAIQQLEILGAHVTYEAFDIADEIALSAFLSAYTEHPIQGIIHTAAAWQDQTGQSVFQSDLIVQSTTVEDLLRTKVQGAQLLADKADLASLDFFLMFSSLSALAGSAGKGLYAASNAYLDGLTHHLRSRGVNAQTINWGFVADVGHGATDEGNRLLSFGSAYGLQPTSLPDLAEALTIALSQQVPQLGVLNIDWQRLQELGTATPWMSEVLAENTLNATTTLSATAHLRRQALLQEAPDIQYTLIANEITERAAQALGIAPTHLQADRPLTDLGIDSLMAMEMRTHIQHEIGVAIPIVKFLEGPTIASLTEFLLDDIRQDVSTQARSIEEKHKPRLDLRDEVILDASIQPPPISSNPSIDTIFLTGGTGFLGVYLLHNLLTTTSATIHCLVRAQDSASGMQRLQSTLETYNLWNEHHAARIIPVVGDLSQPLLGLSPTAFDTLAQTIDVIYHNGAIVHFIYSYEYLKATNVLGTHEVLRLACHTRTKPVHYVSTTSVWGTPPLQPLEDAELVFHDGFDTGYAQSKWVAEHLVREARKRGLPVAIYRPGAIGGDHRTGQWNTGDYISRLLKGCIQLGSIPDPEPFAVLLNHLAPVDYVAAAIVHIAHQETAYSTSAHHIINPHPIDPHLLIQSIRDRGYPLVVQAFEPWLAHLKQTERLGQANALHPFLPLLEADLKFMSIFQGDGAAPTEPMLLSCTHTLKALTDSDITCPALAGPLLDIYFDSFRSTDYLPAPTSLIASPEVE